MALDYNDFLAIRDAVPVSWGANGEEDEDFGTSAIYQTYERVGSVAGVIRAMTAKKLAQAAATPDTFSIPGEYSQSNASGVSALRERLRLAEAAEAASLVASSGGDKIKVFKMIRQDPPGR